MPHTGIDIGIKTSSAITLDNSGKIIYSKQWGTSHASVYIEARHMHPAYRLKIYNDALVEYFESNSITGTVVIEKPMGSMFGNAVRIAELYGVYLVTIIKYIPQNKIFVPTPSEIKKHLSGNGDATKEMMIKKAKRLGYDVKTDHQADSIAMARMSYDGYIFKGDYLENGKDT